MRIIAGRFKGLPIPAALKGTRPTTDRTKEAIFSHLSAQGLISGARVLDLYAGTGALGFEALSRGASQLVAVESSRKAAGLISSSMARLKASPAWGAADSARALPITVERFLASCQPGQAQASPQQSQGPAQTFDLIFIDPPYAYETADCEQLLARLLRAGLVADGCVVVLERSTRSPEPQLPEGWVLDQYKSYGETGVFYLEHRA
ncbi:DNA methyltransferase [Bombiscardovia nodaiensis]|uniref:DNA methyltransferase n=1 Tax=Bombiscardovia nodaiensis TaxID=2932181 RepID=A0ABM8B9H1_9BIFI|nr:DNA methyltransferase [Bombiscardovia nodaiensis]